MSATKSISLFVALSLEKKKKLKMDTSAIKPIIFIGPSGVGKSTIVHALFEKYPGIFAFSVSHTTRKPRVGEVDGKDYHFVTIEDMEKRIGAGEFIEYAKVHGNYYGTSRQGVKDVIANGQICVLDIDVQGARQLRMDKTKNFECTTFFIDPPSTEELSKRLHGRGTDPEETIQLRLKNSLQEIEASKEPGLIDHRVVNDSLEECVAQIDKVLEDQIKICLALKEKK